MQGALEVGEEGLEVGGAVDAVAVVDAVVARCVSVRLMLLVGGNLGMRLVLSAVEEETEEDEVEDQLHLVDSMYSNLCCLFVLVFPRPSSVLNTNLLLSSSRRR